MSKIMVCAAVIVVAALTARAEDYSVTIDDMKCQACDVAVSVAMRKTLQLAQRCAATTPPTPRTTPDAAADVVTEETAPEQATEEASSSKPEAEGCLKVGADWQVDPAAIETVVSRACVDFLDHFPYVQEFASAEGGVIDDESTAEAPAIDQRFVALLQRACEKGLPVSSRKHRQTVVEKLRRTVSTAELDVDGRLTGRRVSQGLVDPKVLANEGNRVQDKEPVNSQTIEEYAATNPGDISIKDREAVRRGKERDVVYGFVLSAQDETCAAACGPIKRPLQEDVIKGWSATGKRL